MKEWLAGLDPQERLLVYAAGAVLAVILLYAVLVHPFHSSYDKLRNGVEESRATLLWMQESALKVKQLKGANPVAGKGIGSYSNNGNAVITGGFDFPDLFGCHDAIHDRHHDITDDNIRIVLQGHTETFISIFGFNYDIGRSEIGFDKIPQLPFIIHDQYSFL